MLEVVALKLKTREVAESWDDFCQRIGEPPNWLAGANLRGASLKGAELWDANLQGANLSGTNLYSAIISSRVSACNKLNIASDHKTYGIVKMMFVRSK